jgi:hypothetical protein
MGKLDDSARLIIKIAYQKLGNKRKVSEMYELPIPIIDQYLLGIDQGALRGRKVIRIEMSRVQAEKEGKEFYKPLDKDKYKGGRAY